jgi:[ribosomal protein S5]-alanine N-acetyltransferase
MFPVALAGRLVSLREFTSGDVDQAIAVVGDDQVTRWLSFDRRSRAETASMIDGIVARAHSVPRTEYYLAVEPLDHHDELAGFVRLGLNGVRAGKLGYAVRADYWGRGYATDAARTMIDFAFGQLELHRVSAAIGPDNTASIQVVRRLGFTEEGRIRDHVFTNGAWRDSVLYSVLAHEWVARSTNALPREGAVPA